MPTRIAEVRGELGSVSRLASPIIATQLAQVGIGVADAIMAGHVSAVDLAGVALGGNLFWPIMMLVSGVIMSVTPSVSQLHGASRESQVGEVVRQALWIALACGVLVAVALPHSAAEIYAWIGVDAQARPIAVGYLSALSVGMVPALGYFAMRYLCDGLSWTLPAMYIAASALMIKIPITYVFVYGGFGIDAMGGVGCGWGSAVVMWYQLIAMVLVVQFSRIKHVGLFSRFSPPDGRQILRLVRLGLPIGATLFFEIAAFSSVSLLIGRLGAEAVAAHQIAIQLGGIVFMVPLAIGMAATIRVGFNVGANDYPKARLSAQVALVVSLLFAALAAALVLVFRYRVAALFTNDVEVITLAAQLMIFVAVFQIFDDVQVAAIGVLRGYKDTRVPMLVTLVSYWGVALPLGAALGFGVFTKPLGVHGFWTGLTIGLGLVALILGARFLWLSRQGERIATLAQR